jgi:hypothetical protein
MSEQTIKIGRRDRLHLELNNVEENCAEFWVMDSSGIGRATVWAVLTDEGYAVRQVTQYANSPEDRVDAAAVVLRVLSVERLERICKSN